MRGGDMEENKIKQMRNSMGMNRREFSEHFGIPVRTIEDWEAGRRNPPSYLPRLMEYQIKYEKVILGTDKKETRND